MVLATVDLATPWSSRLAVEAQANCLPASAAHKGASWQGPQYHCRLQKGQPRAVSDSFNTNSGRHALRRPANRRHSILRAVLSTPLQVTHGIPPPLPASQVLPVAGVDVATPDGAAPLLKALQGQHVSLIGLCLPSYCCNACHDCEWSWQHKHDRIVTHCPVNICHTLKTLMIVVREFMLWQLTGLLCADLSSLPGRRLSAL